VRAVTCHDSTHPDFAAAYFFSIHYLEFCRLSATRASCFCLTLEVIIMDDFACMYAVAARMVPDDHSHQSSTPAITEALLLLALPLCDRLVSWTHFYLTLLPIESLSYHYSPRLLSLTTRLLLWFRTLLQLRNCCTITPSSPKNPFAASY
jgi:hypothetical protein